MRAPVARIDQILAVDVVPDAFPASDLRPDDDDSWMNGGDEKMEAAMREGESEREVEWEERGRTGARNGITNGFKNDCDNRVNNIVINGAIEGVGEDVSNEESAGEEDGVEDEPKDAMQDVSKMLDEMKAFLSRQSGLEGVEVEQGEVATGKGGALRAAGKGAEERAKWPKAEAFRKEAFRGLKL